MPLEYLVRPPKVVLEKNPMLLLLHGYGSNKEDLFSFASELPDNYYVIAAQAPHDMQYGSYAWYAINFDADENKFSDLNQARQSRDLIVDFIDEMKNKYPIDATEISLVGFSQGAILSYAIALSYPEKIKRVIALSGYLNVDMAVEGFEKKDFSKLAIFASHGTVDQVIPVEWARKTPEALKPFGMEVTFKEYPIGHGVSPQNFYDFRKWLLEN
ncbi:alpha/beta hydrolase [Flavobacterium orientale]|uniref:Phospholipase n=1 Tax=Flavobacterium orientale TaxID=1756020 RepID=A0A916Y2E7_9FLAO|nr:alpha/beta fold hydrolase [Flavobacterium orientale]GGD27507.1 phospholipase [Flavobacterium orientale]